MSKKSSAAQVFTAGVDIKNFRDQPEEALEKWRENQRKRGRKPELIDEIVEQDKIYRASLKKKADLAKERGALMQSLNPKKGGVKTEEEKEQIKAQSVELKKQLEDLEVETEKLFKKVEKLLCEVGCMIQPDVPVSLDEANNVTVCTCGKIPEIPNFKPHHE